MIFILKKIEIYNSLKHPFKIYIFILAFMNINDIFANKTMTSNLIFPMSMSDDNALCIWSAYAKSDFSYNFSGISANSNSSGQYNNSNCSQYSTYKSSFSSDSYYTGGSRGRMGPSS
jgi:hypothetical protein